MGMASLATVNNRWSPWLGNWRFRAMRFFRPATWPMAMRLLPILAVAICLLFMPADLCAQTKSKRGAKKNRKSNVETTAPRDYKSKNFLLHTDLGSKDAAELLQRLETMLVLISKYWGRQNRQVIECYVVKDLRKWPQGSLDPYGLKKVAERAGVTMTRTLTRGNKFLAKSIVYAVADRGTPQHEAVHAYCGQAFGRTGPTWYSEGMAEMGQYWRKDDPSVNCHPVVLEYIRQSDPQSLNEIVNGESVTGDSWQNYAWRWALCNLLANNPNYAPRFRPLGLGLLTKQDVSFEQVYGSMAKEISFEYLFFLEHVELGYRVDLCSWDWKTKFRSPRGKSGTAAKVNAARGWQASRVLLKENQEYEFTATGNWQLEKDGEEIDANGAEKGAGKLVGILFQDDYTLSEPFEIGKEGSFTAPFGGKLFLRCRDKWGKIGDNKGRVTVRIKTKK